MVKVRVNQSYAVSILLFHRRLKRMDSFPVETQLVLKELTHSIEQIELVQKLNSFVLLRVISRIMPTEAFLDRLDDLWPD